MAEIALKTELSPEVLTNVSNDFLLGADPEFFVLDPPRQLNNAGEIDCHFEIKAGSVGADHGGRVWELRPSPSPSSYGVVQNIWKLLSSKQMAPAENFRWKSGGTYGADTVGGHVHFGKPRLTPGQLGALDSVVDGLMALEVLPNQEAQARFGRHPEYGANDRTRPCDGHIEYRRACSWLDKPGQALLVLTAMKLAAVDPDSVTWPAANYKRSRLRDWLDWASQKDIDALFLARLLERKGFRSCQADPGCDFKPIWRRETLWR